MTARPAPLALIRTVLVILCAAAWSAGGAMAQSGGESGRYYETETVNPGLSAGEGVNLETPQAMMETFLFSAEDGAWDRAAHALDLSAIPAGEQAARGPELARQMYHVVQRAMWLDWDALSDRPDALDAHSTTRNPVAGQARRNIRLALVKLDRRTVPLRIARVKPASGDPVWMFSGQTVENIPAMFARYGPTRFERMLPGFLRETAFWTLAWWEVLALPVLILAALGVAVMTFSLIGRLARNRNSEVFCEVLRAIRTPAALLAFVGIFSFVRSILFVFSGPVNAFLGPLQTALIVIAIAALALSAIDTVLDYVVSDNIDKLGEPDAEDERNFYTTVSAVRRGVVALIVVAGAALVLIQANVAETLGFSLLFSAGAMGLIIVFAARNALGNLMASLQIAFAKTARIGDAVQYSGNWCYVERIGFTHLQLRRWDGRRIMVPVEKFISESFENWTKQDPSLLERVELHLDHRADVDRLREAFESFVADDEDVIEKDDAAVQVIDHSPEGMTVRFLVCASDPSTGWDMRCRLREAMLRTAAKLEAEHSSEAADTPAYFPREREIQLGRAEG